MSRLHALIARSAHLARVLWAYWRCRRLQFASRAALQAYQEAKLAKFLPNLAKQSPYFAPFARLSLAQWPRMDKSQMMAHFDTMNTAGLTLEAVMRTAMHAETVRNFEPKLHGFTVGLSSGTSAMRGAFVVSNAEASQWAGIMLAKTLPAGVLNGERVALFLRANSQLYSAVQSRWIGFEFFDLFAPLGSHEARLIAYRPSVIVAPAQVLKALASAVLAQRITLRPKRVISVAEVLSPQDRSVIEQAFGKVHEVYQATEGFLASTCERGVLHLNEEYVHIEPEWLDAERRRFVPIITDFTRLTQPIVRYRLNDVLRARASPCCCCGRVTLALDAIEGRCDDQLALPAMAGGTVIVFADVLSRILARALPQHADYRLHQHGNATLKLYAKLDGSQWQHLLATAQPLLQHQGVDTDRIEWQLHADIPTQGAQFKLRRIVRHLDEPAELHNNPMRGDL